MEKKICRGSKFASSTSNSSCNSVNNKCSGSKRDALADLTNSLIPTEVLLDLYSNSVSTSKAHDLLRRSQSLAFPTSKDFHNSKSDSNSDTSIGSSNFNSIYRSRTATPVRGLLSNSSSANLELINPWSLIITCNLDLWNITSWINVLRADEKMFYHSCRINGAVYKLRQHVLIRFNSDRLIPSKLQAGWRTYQRPEDKPGGHGVGWSLIIPYTFSVPQDWDEVPISIANLGGIEIDLRFASPKQGRLFVIVAPCKRF